MKELRKAIGAALRVDALRQLSQRLAEEARVLRIRGAAGSAKTLAVARAALSENRPMAVLTASNAEAQTLAQDLRSLLELASDDSRTVVHLPGLEVDPYRGL